MVKNPPANAGDLRDAGLIPGSGRSPGRGNGNPLQYSCLRIPRMEEPGGLRPIAPQSQYTAEAAQHTCGTYCVVESPEVFGMEISCISASCFSRCSGNHRWAASTNVRSEGNGCMGAAGPSLTPRASEHPGPACPQLAWSRGCERGQSGRSPGGG